MVGKMIKLLTLTFTTYSLSAVQRMAKGDMAQVQAAREL